MHVSFLAVLAQRDTTIFNSKGEVEYKGQIVNGKRIGNWIKYTPKGKIREKITYLENNRFEKKIYRYLDETSLEQEYVGYLKNNDEVIDGEYVMYFKDGIVTRTLYKDNLKEGESKTFYTDKKTKRIEHFTHGVLNGRWIEYFENDTIKQTGIYKEGEKIGEWKRFYKNGALLSIGSYIPAHTEIGYNDNVVDSLKTLPNYSDFIDDDKGVSFPIIVPLKDKTWKCYSEEGKLIKEETWDKGKLIKTKEY